MNTSLDLRHERWSLRTRLVFGALAASSLVLLCVVAVAALAAGVEGTELLVEAGPLFQLHLVYQLIVLGIFGAIMMNNPSLTVGGRWLWSAYFMTLPPAAVVSYWLVHVWSAQAVTPTRARAVSLGLRAPPVTVTPRLVAA